MLVKDKIFIVAYVDVSSISDYDVGEYLSVVEHHLGHLLDESVTFAIIPVRDEDTRIECINPVLLNEEQYANVQEKINNMQTAFDEFLKQGKKKKER